LDLGRWRKSNSGEGLLRDRWKERKDEEKKLLDIEK